MVTPRAAPRLLLVLLRQQGPLESRLDDILADFNRSLAANAKGRQVSTDDDEDKVPSESDVDKSEWWPGTRVVYLLKADERGKTLCV